MKDIIITSKRIQKELYILAATFSFAFIINVVAILKFKTPWYEIFTQIGFVVVITIILYLIVLLFRLIILLTKNIFKRKN